MLNKYKISLKVKKIIPKSYINNILINFIHYINNTSMCFITNPNNNTIIYYLNIYLNDLISLETFMDLSILLSIIKHSMVDNIKMKDVRTDEIIYSLIPKCDKKSNNNKITRHYTRIY